MNYLIMSIPDPEYSHFMRQIYVISENSVKIPECLIIEFEDNQYRIFLSAANAACFTCKETGHIPSKCLLKTTSAVISNQLQEIKINKTSESLPNLPQISNKEGSSRPKRTILKTLKLSTVVDISESISVKPNRRQKNDSRWT
ncbi:hypothetical protein WA026_021841 [Henosepilachna vigintioctopunctata]|uniref:CCHC-type domain-containing protein n=1 Tax=Henosepilachna vigintioctopunctata TaxID=420089 RepID=A0AAW1UN50_9CUCU